MNDREPGAQEAAVILHAFELDALADTHAELAGQAIRDGQHELHDKHACREYELRAKADKLRPPPNADSHYGQTGDLTADEMRLLADALEGRALFNDCQAGSCPSNRLNDVNRAIVLRMTAKRIDPDQPDRPHPVGKSELELLAAVQRYAASGWVDASGDGIGALISRVASGFDAMAFAAPEPTTPSRRTPPTSLDDKYPF